jgi:hypothetical protein
MNWKKKLTFQSGEYGTDLFWHDINVQNKTSYQKILSLRIKNNVWLEDFFSSGFDIENLRLAHAYCICY